MKVNIMRLNCEALLPTNTDEFSAGYDLYACIPDGKRVMLCPGDTKFINTRIACAFYRGEIIVALHNDSNQVRYVQNGDRIAQLVIHEFQSIEWQEVEGLDKTERQNGGFGHSGK